MGEHAAEHFLPFGQPILGSVIGSVERYVAMPSSNIVKNSLLLGSAELEFIVATIGNITISKSYFSMAAVSRIAASSQIVTW